MLEARALHVPAAMDKPTARIRRRDLRVLVHATRMGAMQAVPLLGGGPVTTLPVKPLPLGTERVPINPVTVALAFVVGIGIGFLATVPLW